MNNITLILGIFSLIIGILISIFPDFFIQTQNWRMKRMGYKNVEVNNTFVPIIGFAAIIVGVILLLSSFFIK